MGIGALKLVHDMVMLSSPFVLQRLLQNLQDGGSRCALAHYSPASCGRTVNHIPRPRMFYHQLCICS